SPAATCFLSALTAMERTSAALARRVWSSSCDAHDQMRTVPSELPETSQEPSALNVTELTQDLWPDNVDVLRPVPTSQSLIVPSILPVASVDLSRLNATLRTGPRCPTSVCFTSAERASQIAAV